MNGKDTDCRKAGGSVTSSKGSQGLVELWNNKVRHTNDEASPTEEEMLRIVDRNRVQLGDRL